MLQAVSQQVLGQVQRHRVNLGYGFGIVTLQWDLAQKDSLLRYIIINHLFYYCQKANDQAKIHEIYVQCPSFTLLLSSMRRIEIYHRHIAT